MVGLVPPSMYPASRAAPELLTDPDRLHEHDRQADVVGPEASIAELDRSRLAHYSSAID
jgi:hypothetical protein